MKRIKIKSILLSFDEFSKLLVKEIKNFSTHNYLLTWAVMLANIKSPNKYDKNCLGVLRMLTQKKPNWTYWDNIQN